MSHIFSPVGQRGTVWRSTGWSPNRTEQLLYKVFWHLWDVTGSLVLPSSETETLMLTEPKPVSQISPPPPCWSYLVSSVLRNRLCTIFLSSSAGATFSREAVLSSTRRSLLARDHKDGTNSRLNDVQTQGTCLAAWPGETGLILLRNVYTETHDVTKGSEEWFL